MTSDPTPEKDDDALAAEYALHLLAPAARAAFDDRLAVDGALRAKLAFWSEHMAGLDAETTPVAPPNALRDTLAKAVKADTVPEQGAKAPSRFSFGGFLAGVGLALALGLVAVTQLPEVRLPGAAPAPEVIAQPAPPPAPPPVILPEPAPFAPDYFAELAAPEGALVIAVAYSDASGEFRLQRSVGQAPEGRVLQLWLIADASPDPVSLGVLPDTPDAVLSVPDALRPDMPGATLAISEEPVGGSQGTGPSGAVLAAAALTDA